MGLKILFAVIKKKGENMPRSLLQERKLKIPAQEVARSNCDVAHARQKIGVKVTAKLVVVLCFVFSHYNIVHL